MILMTEFEKAGGGGGGDQKRVLELPRAEAQQLKISIFRWLPKQRGTPLILWFKGGEEEEGGEDINL